MPYGIYQIYYRSGKIRMCHNTFVLYLVSTRVALSVLYSGSVFLKVGGIAPLGAIWKGKGAKKTKGAVGGRSNTKGAKMRNY